MFFFFFNSFYFGNSNRTSTLSIESLRAKNASNRLLRACANFVSCAVSQCRNSKETVINRFVCDLHRDGFALDVFDRDLARKISQYTIHQVLL